MTSCWRICAAAALMTVIGAFCLLAVSLGAEETARPPPQLPQLSIPDKVNQNAFLSVKLPVRDRVRNAYDSREIDVFARVVAPSGRELLVPAYFQLGFDPSTNARTKDDGWRLNFCPEETGLYQLQVYVRKTGEAERALAEGHFIATASVDPGFVGVSDVPSGYFSFRSGRVFFPVGLNFCWDDSQNFPKYLQTLLGLSRQGVTCLRIWLTPWWLQLEKPAGVYDPRACAMLDAILDTCERCGICVILCVEQPVGFRWDKDNTPWRSNPYNHELGGPCTKTNDFFTDEGARTLTRRKLRYLVARYGARRSIMAWELFNEVEYFPFTFGHFKENEPAVLDWHREMALYLRRTDPYGHLISTSSDKTLQDRLLDEGLIDFEQLHVYPSGDVGAGVANALAPVAADTGAPVLVGEFGGHAAPTDLIAMRHGTWVTMATGGAGAGLYWWQFSDALREGAKTLRAVSRFTAGIRWADEQFAPATMMMASAEKEKLPEARKDILLKPGLGFGAERAGVCAVGRDGSVSGEQNLPSFLLGRDQRSGRTSCVLKLDPAGEGKLRVKVNTVSDRATLDLVIDGMPTAHKLLATGPQNKEAKNSRWVPKWKVYEDVYDKEYEFDLPGGAHEIRLDNTGRGWIKIDYLALPAYRIEQTLPISAYGLCGRNAGLVYIVVTDPKVSEEGGGIFHVNLWMEKLPDGAYKVTWYDCGTGEEISTADATCAEGQIALSVPEFQEHIAGKLVRQF